MVQTSHCPNLTLFCLVAGEVFLLSPSLTHRFHELPTTTQKKREVDGEE